ncbi:plasmid pRiA4b ORF-3 family protein [Desulfofundulus sp. TPOSR]|uniref:plasmid pRiA4b ORF-3 family protein n=1 Tax=Desulfofundulus sp. TPOSR TaxID=2714340 RepID=UPI0028BE9DA9|nr:plasmid pRiA4b ORF-3 family protein [Desulfofundulus sp. TPOSR]
MDYVGSNVVYQLKITLQEIEPPIWRRVLVPAGITFYKLHKIIQAAFGWQDYHLFDFDFGDVVVHIPDPDYAPGELYGGAKELNAKRTKIDALLSERKKCVYTYDFGDNWRHDVILETIMPVEEGRRYPVCVAGARHRPPEDVGGVSGYEEFLRIIRDPGHPEYNDYLVWAEKDTGGRKFDPEYFYINEVNRALAKIKSTTPH